jgi:8-oxo-dGTP diphosphatase
MELRNMASMIIRNDNEVLLLHKQTRYHDKPMWIPGAGGHFEHGEMNDPEACLWREVKEEIGLEAEAFENVKLRYIALRNSGDQIRINYYYFGDLREGISRNLASIEGELQWFTFQDSLNCDMPPSFKACFNHYLDAGYCNDYVYVAVGTINADGNVEHTITPLMAY